jgi:hypothetical protein
MDETSGNRVDFKNGNDLAVEGTNAYTTGIVSNAFSFNGASCLKISDASQTGLDPTGDFSFSFWFKKISDTIPANASSIFGKDAVSNRSYWCYVNDGNPHGINFALNDTSTVSSAVNLAQGTWYHAVFTYDYVASGTSVGKCYINGSQSGSTNSTMVGPEDDLAADFQVGARQYTTSRLFLTGYVDELGFWNKVLSTAEITALYNGGAGNTLKDVPSDAVFFAAFP